MSIFPLLAGIGAGALLIALLAVVSAPRIAHPAARGYLNALGVGIAVNAMVDLLPVALDNIKALVSFGLQAILLGPLNIAPNSPVDLAALLVGDLVRPLGGVLVLFLYLAGNSLPMLVDGKLVGRPATGWRAWLVIPAGGEMDWKGIAFVAIGLAVQNLWVAQMRGALISPASQSLVAFMLLLGAVGALRASALLGAVRNWWWAPVGSLLIAAPLFLGVLLPASRESILLGVLPTLVAMLLVPLAMGRALRTIQADIGLGWRTTAVVLAGLLVSRLLDGQILSVAQGYLP